MPKYRTVKRKVGWRVQEWAPGTLPGEKAEWLNIASWRWHWAAALHLLWLRERARK